MVGDVNVGNEEGGGVVGWGDTLQNPPADIRATVKYIQSVRQAISA